MISQMNSIDVLKGLPQAKLYRQLQRLLSDSLQALVAELEHAAAVRGLRYRSCVVDEIRIGRVEMHEQECRVLVRFNASAQQTGTQRRLTRLAGVADASIDDAGTVTYSNVVFTEEQAFEAHDVGGGD
jgi:hypothetical protein